MLIIQEPKSQCVTCRLTSETLSKIEEEARKGKLSISSALEANVKQAFEILFEAITEDETHGK
jgi:hypothetical protein